MALVAGRHRGGEGAKAGFQFPPRLPREESARAHNDAAATWLPGLEKDVADPVEGRFRGPCLGVAAVPQAVAESPGRVVGRATGCLRPKTVEVVEIDLGGGEQRLDFGVGDEVRRVL